MALRGNLFRLVQKLSSLARVAVSVGARPEDVRKVIQLLWPQPSPQTLIRVGAGRDGGYLIPDDLEGVLACFSPGVAATADFEQSLVDRGIRCFLADYSVERAPIKHELVDFEKVFLGTVTGNSMFLRLEDWIDKKNVSMESDLILQMDIEGAEWTILADVHPNVLKRFRIIVIELHNLDTVLTNLETLKQAESIFSKLASSFIPVHIHPNNSDGEVNWQGVKIPRVLEVTFLRKDRVTSSSNLYGPETPHRLDVINDSSRKPISLSSDWTNLEIIT